MRRIRTPLFLALLLAASLPAASQEEPTSEELWRRQPPPFQSKADGLVAPPRSGGALEMRLGAIPWYLPPEQAEPTRLRALEQAASHVAQRYARIGLRAPRITRRDGVYPIYFVRDLGGAAAQYGPGYGEFGTSEALRWAEDDWDRVMIVSEVGGFGKDFAIFPEKAAASAGHELLHGVQASYAYWSGHDNSQAHEEKWVTEALPDAISLWAIQGLAFMGNPPFDPRRRFSSGNWRFGKALGMRPYDYPLDLRQAPPRMRIFPQGDSQDSLREMASYMTSSFWSYAWDHSMPAGKAWMPLPRALLLRTPRRGTSSVREDALAWTDRSLGENHPAWTRGLYDALPAFIPWWVAYPDEVMRSRKGEFEHSRWLGHAFVDGCPLYELNEDRPTATMPVAIRELAAQCVRVKWTGAPMGKSGWPAAALVVVPKDGGGESALSDLHLGMHGTKLGKTDPFVDPTTGLPSLAWSGLTLDPRHPAQTDGETVITFINVSRDPLKTVRRVYEVHLGMATTTVTGQLEKPEEPNYRPASTARTEQRRRGLPAQVVPLPPGKSLSLALTTPAKGKDDCSNATAKTAGLVALGTDSPAVRAGAPNLMTICLEVAAGATRASLHPSNQPEVTLKLPAIRDGQTGLVSGGSVIATWTDPGLGAPGKQHVDARTKDVEISITQSNPAFVTGRFTARFKAPGDGANGLLSGDFVAWRTPTDQRLPLVDPIDYASSDLLRTFAAMGKRPEEMRSQLGRRNPPRGRATAPTPAVVDAQCPMDCEALGDGKVSPACLQLMSALYEACPDGDASTRDDVLSLATWVYRGMPEPMRTEMTQATVQSVMQMPGALREDWVRKVRAQRNASGD